MAHPDTLPHQASSGLLAAGQDRILAEQWTRLVAADYGLPENRPVRSEDPFLDPAAELLRKAASGLGQLLGSARLPENGQAWEDLEALLRLAAARGLAPAAALAPFFRIRELLADPIPPWPGQPDRTGGPAGPDGQEVHSRLERIALRAAACYCASRETLLRLKIDEQERRFGRLRRHLERSAGGDQPEQNDLSCNPGQRAMAGDAGISPPVGEAR